MAADRLLPNPDGCRQFEPNVFRREKCRVCGHSWQYHKDAISESEVRTFITGQRQSAEDKANAVAEAKAKARSKAQAKARAQRAVEDTWLFDDAGGNDASEFGSAESEDEGFQMFAGTSLASAPFAQRSSGSGSARPLKIVNLVDFGECDVLAGPSGGDARSSGSANSSGRRSLPPAAPPPHGPAASAGPGLGPRPPPEHRGSRFSTPMQSKDDVLLEEIQYLRQMLADANEEKNIQIAIVRDEISEKQRIIDELTRRGGEAEASLRLTRTELEQLRGEHAEHGGCGDAAAALAPTASAPGAVEPRVHAGRAEEALQKCLEQQQLELHKCLDELRASKDRERELRVQWQRCSDEQRALREECAARLRELEARGEAASARLAAREEELERMAGCRAELAACEERLREANARLARREALSDAVAACRSEAELKAWELELRETAQLAMDRLAGRRVELRVAAIMDSQDTALCKICYERPASCALLPCRHHAFCRACARRVEASDPTCPLCRSPVTGRFETFAS